MLVLTTLLLLTACKKNTNNGANLEENAIKDNTEQIAAAATEAFVIKLNTIYGENGLDDYAQNASEVTGEIVKQLQGTDGNEYYLLRLDKSLEYTEREKSELYKTNYLIVGGRFKGQPLQKGAASTVVNVAIVKDETLISDEILDFSKAIFAGFGEATEINR